MKIFQTGFKGLVVIQNVKFEDSRRYFFELYNQQGYKNNDINDVFVQDNISKSANGSLRGLHFQNPPYDQGKLISVINGKVLDVVVDIRKEEETYGSYFSVVLSEQNGKQVFIPSGFAHGFLTLEDDTIFHYKCTNFYNQEYEFGIAWNDPHLAINWGIAEPVISKKDGELSSWNDFISMF